MVAFRNQEKKDPSVLVTHLYIMTKWDPPKDLGHSHAVPRHPVRSIKCKPTHQLFLNYSLQLASRFLSPTRRLFCTNCLPSSFSAMATTGSKQHVGFRHPKRANILPQSEVCIWNIDSLSFLLPPTPLLLIKVIL